MTMNVNLNKRPATIRISLVSAFFLKSDFSPVGLNSGAQDLGTADDRTGMPRHIVRDAENYKMP